MSEKNSKTRISVTMTKPYLDALDHLVDKGIFLDKGEIVRQSLRDLFRNYGIEPFTSDEPQKLEEPR